MLLFGHKLKSRVIISAGKNSTSLSTAQCFLDLDRTGLWAK